jgi:hypothetical protein
LGIKTHEPVRAIIEAVTKMIWAKEYFSRCARRNGKEVVWIICNLGKRVVPAILAGKVSSATRGKSL